MMTKPRPLRVLLSLGLGLSLGCGALPNASHRVYDFDSVFLNGDMRGQQPWKAPDRVALRNAVREQRVELLKQETAAVGGARARRTLEPRRTGGETEPPARKRALPNHIAAHVAESNTSGFDDLKPPTRLPGLILGDGSVRGEVSAAAARLVGMGSAISPLAFIQHLEKAGAVVFPKSQQGQGGIAKIWGGLEARGATYGPGTLTPMPGDLVFFHDVGDVDGDGQSDALSGVGVVAQIVDSETLVCIAPVMGAVRRIYLTPGKPTVRRDGNTTLNTPVRRRRRDDGANVPTLSGQVLAGFARI
jgi:hypothetical protein